MRSLLHVRLLKTCFFYLSCFCILMGWAQAQTPAPTPTGPIQMTVASPFTFTPKPLVVLARAGQWLPIAVTLANTGDEVSGEVRLQFQSTSGFENNPNDFYSTVDLPSNSRKVVWLYGRIDRGLISSFRVTFSGRGVSPLTAEGTIQPPDDDQKVVLTIADTQDGLAGTLKDLRGQAVFWSGQNGQAGGISTNVQPVRALQLSHELVPDRWFGLAAADMVILGDFAHATLNPPQIEALRGFVYGGGNLVVVGGGNTARLSTSPLKDLWPLSPKNSGLATASEVQGLVQRYVSAPKNGADRLGGAPVQLVRGTLDANSVLKDGSASSPLFALRDLGAGRCLFLSYNPAEPPFTGWSGQGALWRDVFTSCIKTQGFEGIDSNYINTVSGIVPGYNSTYNGNFNNGGYNSYGYSNDMYGASTSPTGQLLRVVSRAPQLRLPPVSRIAWFLALYVFFLVPVNYAVLRIIDRRELAWITIPVIVAIFSIWAYAAARSIRGTAILTRQIDVVQSSVGGTSGRDDSLLWLYSPRRTTYDIVSLGKNAAVSDYADAASLAQGPFSILQPGDGASFKVEAARLATWTDRAFVAQSIVPMGNGLQMEGRSLKNNTPYDLEGAVWIQDRSVRTLGNINKSASVTVPEKSEVYSGDIAGGITRGSGVDRIFDTFTSSNGIPNQILSVILGTNLGKLNGQPVVLAWAKNPVAAMEVNGSQSLNVTLFVFRVPKLPKELLSKEAIVTRVSFEPFQAKSTPATGYSTGPAGGYAFYDCTLPRTGNLNLRAAGMGLYRRRGNVSPGSPPAPPGVLMPPPGMPYSATPSRAGNTLQFEYKDARTNIWKPLPGTLRYGNAVSGSWQFRAKIDQSWARQPDLVLQVRARMSSQQISIPTLEIKAD